MASLKAEIKGGWQIDNGSSFQPRNVAGNKDSCKRKVLQCRICKLYAIQRLCPMSMGAGYGKDK